MAYGDYGMKKAYVRKRAFWFHKCHYTGQWIYPLQNAHTVVEYAWEDFGLGTVRIIDNKTTEWVSLTGMTVVYLQGIEEWETS